MAVATFWEEIFCGIPIHPIGNTTWTCTRHPYNVRDYLVQDPTVLRGLYTSVLVGQHVSWAGTWPGVRHFKPYTQRLLSALGVLTM